MRHAALIWLAALATGVPAQGEFPPRLLEEAGKSMVPVTIQLRREAEDPTAFSEARLSPYQSYMRSGSPLLTAGLVLDGEGRILIADNGLEWDLVERIDVVRRDGSSLEARFEEVLEKCPGVVLRVGSGDGLPPMPFAASAGTSPVAGVSVYRGRGTFVVWGGWLQPLCIYGEDGPAHRFTFGSADMEYVDEVHPAPVFIVGDASGAPMGVGFFNLIDVGGSRGIWRGPEFANASGLTRAELEKAATSLKSRWKSAFAVAVLRYRQPRMDEEDPYGFARMMFRRGMLGEGDSDGLEQRVVAAAIGPRRLLIPEGPDRTRIARLDSVEIEIGDRKLKAKYAGATRAWHAMLLETEEDLPGAHLVSGNPPPLPTVEPVLAMLVEEQYGEVQHRTLSTRYLTEKRGYDGRYHPEALVDIGTGSWIFTLAGELLGVHLIERRAELELESGAQSGPFGWMPQGQDGFSRFVSLPDLEASLREPGAIDPNLVPRPEGDEDRSVWIGVETTPMSYDLAKSTGVRKETRDGSIGLIVNVVYPGSPAEKAGILEGDVLLKAKPRNRAKPLELRAFGSPEAAFPDFPFEGDDALLEGMGGMPDRPPWPSQQSYLKNLMAAIGADMDVELDLLRNGKSQAIQVRLELGPHDFDSAPRYKNREIGLTVKPLTYEVRRALSLEAEERAVVISAVEPGSAAALAKLRPYELVTAIDGRTIGSPEELQKIVESAAASGKPSLKLTVRRLGRTRFADLKLGGE